MTLLPNGDYSSYNGNNDEENKNSNNPNNNGYL